MNVLQLLLCLIMATLLSGCTANTEIIFDIIGTGFQDATFEEPSISCRNPATNSRYSGDVTITKRVLGRIRMEAKINVPKNHMIECAFSGEGLAQLPNIPVYNNSYRSRTFAVKKHTRIKVRLHRQAFGYDNETYDHIVFKKIDHIANKDIVLPNKTLASTR